MLIWKEKAKDKLEKSKARKRGGKEAVRSWDISVLASSEYQAQKNEWVQINVNGLGRNQDPRGDSRHYVWGRGPSARHMGACEYRQDYVQVLSESEHTQWRVQYSIWSICDIPIFLRCMFPFAPFLVDVKIEVNTGDRCGEPRGYIEDQGWDVGKRLVHKVPHF